MRPLDARTSRVLREPREHTTGYRARHAPRRSSAPLALLLRERLRLHYVDWGNEDKPLLLLVHGGRDHARSWDWVARELRHEWHVVAPDLRGHGDSAWAIGSSYPLSDFVFDIAQLLEALDAHPATIVAHSLGARSHSSMRVRSRRTSRSS
jgi:pimeloyl-ACP methyl ester carboxylesterase